jgi:peptidoglycan/LPS O-acetylase OafA/YrhL
LPMWLAGPVRILGTACAFVGTYSYSIYLWHIPFQAFAAGVLRRLFGIRFDSVEQFWFYLTGSIVFGILMAKLIEFPVLGLRDKFYPTMQMHKIGIPIRQEMPPITAPEVSQPG